MPPVQLSALAIILFIDCWNEYFWPLLVTDAPESRTVQVGIREFLEGPLLNATYYAAQVIY
jgi:ABC-type glycerol-3-phosphate transport system permease component